MIALHNVSLSFGQTIIFDEASLKINPGQRLGICAPNGTGKTTLLACLAGEQEVHSGSVSRPEKLRLAYFHQQGVELGSKTIRAELEGAYAEYFALGQQIVELEQQIEQLSRQAHDAHAEQDAPHSKEMARLGQAIDQLEHLHQRQAEISYQQREAEMVYMLRGLGFQASDLDRPGGEFSGGWQMKVGLARVLLSKPEVLMLDEPTNHLDLEARMWLIEVLQKLDCMQIIISHDRYFLDHTITSVAELWDGKINLYAGNYSKYEVERDRQREAQEKQRLAHQRFLKKEEAFIERFRYKATKARQVQSRIKLLEKMEQPEAAAREQSQVRLEFVQSHPSGEQVVEVENICKSYDGQMALEHIYFTLGRGEKVALLGPNGAGKSTLMRIMAGQDKSYSGKLRWGAHVQLAYFSQRAADLLTESDSVWDYINSLESSADELARRKTLGMFLFSDDDVFQPIAKLSGGEKARVLLCSLVLQPCNFLILDEPTNHLDLDTQQVLLEALQDFPGAVLFTTHDRYLLEQLASKVVLLEKPGELTGQGGVSSKLEAARSHIYYGDYSYYLWKQAEEAQVRREIEAEAENRRNSTSSASEPSSESRSAYRSGKEERALRRKLEREEEKLLSQIDQWERQIAEVQESFGTEAVYANVQNLQQQKDRLHTAELELEQLHQRWEEIQGELEALG